MDELVIDAVKLSLMLLVPRALGLPGGQAAGIVGVVLEGRELAQGIDAALKGDLRRRDEFAVLGGQLVFLGHLVQDGGRERLVGDLGVDEHQAAVLGLELLAERRRQHSLAPGVLALLQLGDGLVPEVHLLVVEFVAGVNAVAHAGQLGGSVNVFVERFLFQEDFAGLGVGFGVFQPGAQVGELLLDRIQIRAGIGHF